jgi:hypothetical protein
MSINWIFPGLTEAYVNPSFDRFTPHQFSSSFFWNSG